MERCRYNRIVRRSRLGSGIVGIQNTTSAMCYAISAIQALMNSKILSEWLRELDREIEDRGLHILKLIRESMDDGDDIDIREALEYLSEIFDNQMSLDVQDDAHMLLMLLIDRADLRDLFRIDIEIHTQCTQCDLSEFDVEEIYDIPLVNPSDSPEYTFDEAMDQYLADYEIMGECPRCGGQNTRYASRSIKDLSDIMIFTLFSRDSGEMKYPQCAQMDNDDMFEIRSVIDHRGSTRSGHYTAKLYSDGQWWLTDDCTVSRITPRQVISSDNYILIYDKIR